MERLPQTFLKRYFSEELKNEKYGTDSTLFHSAQGKRTDTHLNIKEEEKNEESD